MPTDFLSSYGATRDLDRELGFGWPSVGLNDPQLAGREVSNYGGMSSYFGNLSPDEMYGITNRRNQQQLAQQSQQQRAIQAYNPQPYSNLPPSSGGRPSPSFSNYLNPQAIGTIVAAQRTPSRGDEQYNQRFTQPSHGDYLGTRRDTADYSTAGQNQRDRPLTDAERYGSTLQGGRWVPNRPPGR